MKCKIMSLFTKWFSPSRKEDLDTMEEDLATRLVNINLDSLKRDGQLRIREELLKTKEDSYELVKTLRDDNYSAKMDYVTDFNQDLTEKKSILAGLDAEIKLKRELYDLLKDQNTSEINMLKQSQSVVVANYKEMVELLKTQVEILTAKLTELKITDAHIHVDAKMSKE